MGIEAVRLPREAEAARPPAGERGHLRTLKGVTLVREGQQLLKGIDLAINRGECLVILGPNGAGKTLLMQVAHRLLAPTQGSVSTDPVREAMVFQRPVLLRRSVLDNVLYVLDHARLGPAGGPAGASIGASTEAPRPVGTADRMARALAALRLVGLERLARRPARVLSGGEQQRVALARAAVVQPDLIWFDEPTANLDPGIGPGHRSLRDAHEPRGCHLRHEHPRHRPGTAPRPAGAADGGGQDHRIRACRPLLRCAGDRRRASIPARRAAQWLSPLPTT